MTVLDDKTFKTKNFTLKGRIFHPNLFEPKGSKLAPDKLKYSVLFAWSMKDQQAQTQEIIQWIQAGRQSLLGTIPDAGVKLPLKTWGQTHRTDGKPQPSYLEDCMWINASANPSFKPAVVDGNNNPILDSSMVYSGANALVNFSFWVYKMGSHGIGVNLNAVRIESGGEKEVGGGGISVDEAFKGFLGETAQPVAQPFAPAQPAQQQFAPVGQPTNTLV